MTRLFDLPHAATTDDWYTPAWIFEGMDVNFALDVAAPPGGVPWIPAEHYYTPDDDGLVQPWHGLVWCNPPYSNVRPWCEKWATHGNGVIALRADLSTKGPALAFEAATSIAVPFPRLKFVDGQGDTKRKNLNMAVNFSTVLLGAGAVADYALERLSDRAIYRRLV